MTAPEEPTAPTPAPEAIDPAPSAAITTTPVEDGVQEESAPTPPPPPREPFLASPERYLYWQRLLDGALIALVLLLAFEIGFFPVRNPDLLLHRAVGRQISQGQFDFHSDPFAYTTEGSTWVDHSWLFGVFAYGMNRLGEVGDTTLIVLKALLFAALAELMIRL